MTDKEVKNILNEIITPEIRAKADEIEIAIVNNRGEKLYNQYGPKKVGDFIRSTAINQAKKNIQKQKQQSLQEPNPTEQTPKGMNEDKIRQMVKDALSKPLAEKKAKPDFLDLDKDGNKKESMKKAVQDKKKIQMEDLDLGHEDNEPHMIKGELYKIAQNATALYKMLDQYDGINQEVDLPAWWQAKVTKACTMLGSAKNYLEFELKEPQIDNTIEFSSSEETIDEKMSKKQVKKRGEIYDTLKAQGMSDEKAGRIATSKAQKIKEAVLAKLKNK